MNRDFHERRGVVRVNNFQTRREERFHLRQFSTDCRSGIQRVCTGRQLDPQTGSRLAVKLCDDVVVLTTQLNLRDVTQQHAGTILIHFQQDFAELFSRGQTRLSNNRGVKLLAFHRRRTTELTRRNLGVLRFDGGNDINRR